MAGAGCGTGSCCAGEGGFGEVYYAVSDSGREVALDCAPGNEADAEARLHGTPHRLLQPELEPHVQVAVADPGSAQLVLDDLPDAGTPVPPRRVGTLPTWCVLPSCARWSSGVRHRYPI